MDLSRLEHRNVGELMDFQPEIDGTGGEIEELTLAAQKFTESTSEGKRSGEY
jgi:hypothetical protein